VSEPAGAPHYLLGHTPAELHRLDVQNELYRDATLRALRDAGVGPGMRVLDIGCGTGGVSLLAAEVVGREGSVLGVDRGEQALAAARANAEERGLANVDFVRAEVDTLNDSSRFDALVGRFVLMHQPRPAEVLAAAARALRPGGRAVFVESWMALLEHGAHSMPHSPLYDEIVRWKCAVVGGAGADLEAGGRLRRTFLDAGLRDPVTRLEARLEGGPDSPYYRYVAESVRSMLPEARRLGLAGYDDRDADALADRLRDEAVALGSALVVWPVALGWATKA
jgi:ubiquinone/menaquinone biosynthesis C-methylase UbiE